MKETDFPKATHVGFLTKNFKISQYTKLVPLVRQMGLFWQRKPHCLIHWIFWAKPSAARAQRGLLGNSVLILKASLPAEPYSSFWNQSCPVHSIWCSLPGPWLVEQVHFQRICFPILLKKKKFYPWSPLKAEDAHTFVPAAFVGCAFSNPLRTLRSWEHRVCPLAPSSGTVQVWMSPLQRSSDVFIR